MGKKRIRTLNPQPFLADDNKSSKKRSKPAKQHQKQDELISFDMSSKILKEALAQQKEIEDEEDGPPSAFSIVATAEQKYKLQEEDDNDIDDFAGFSETQTQFGDYEEEIDPDEIKLLEAFLSKDAGRQRTLADAIVEKSKEKESNISSETGHPSKIDNSLIELYKNVGKCLNIYTSGKFPKAFKHIPSMQHWKVILELTEPEKWSPNAMYQATRIFASNMTARNAAIFYELVLLPRVREDIRKHQRLHFALYQALKKSIYKPSAFNKGILFPLCESGTCNLREAVIIGSIIQKVSIPPEHSSIALIKLAEMEYCGTTSYFIKLFLEKKYKLPYRALDAVVAHFLRFSKETRVMPVIWHQSLLALAQRYKDALRKDDKERLKYLIAKQKHSLVSPEISRELDALPTTTAPVSNKTIEEDRFDIPDVPMEED